MASRTGPTPARTDRVARFTRGTSRDPYARYTEEGGAYVDNMQRLLRKFETMKSLVPAPIRQDAERPTRFWRDLVRLYLGSDAGGAHGSPRAGD